MFNRPMLILSKFSIPCGYLLRSIVTVSFSKNSNGIFQYFFRHEGNSKARHSINSCKKCQRNRPNYYLDVLKFMLSTKTKEITLSVRGEQYNFFAFPRGLEASMNFNTSAKLQYLLDSVITCWSRLEHGELPHVCPLKRLPVFKGGSVAKHRAGKFKMVGILSKIPPPAQLLNSKAAGIAVASVGAGILLLWKKKLEDLSAKRYWRSYYQFQPGYSQLS